jgi:hypothetical protein
MSEKNSSIVNSARTALTSAENIGASQIVRVAIFGDTRGFQPEDPVMTWTSGPIGFPIRYICDFTEDGLYIASRWSDNATIKEVKIEEALQGLNPDIEIASWLCGQAFYMKEKGIKTVKQLIEDIQSKRVKA